MLSLLFALDKHSQEIMMQAHKQQEVTRHGKHSGPEDPMGISQGTWDPAHHRASANHTSTLWFTTGSNHAQGQNAHPSLQQSQEHNGDKKQDETQPD